MMVEATRQRILAAAEGCYYDTSDHGHQLSIKCVADAAGVVENTLRHYYPGKRHLLHGLMLWLLTDAAQQMRAVQQRSGSFAALRELAKLLHGRPMRYVAAEALHLYDFRPADDARSLLEELTAVMRDCCADFRLDEETLLGLLFYHTPGWCLLAATSGNPERTANTMAEQLFDAVETAEFERT